MSKNKKAKDYRIELKEKTAKLYLEGNLSDQKLSEQPGMKNPTSIRSRVNKIKRRAPWNPAQEKRPPRQNKVAA